ncbi:MAG: CCA tRNA nucleotidyltransferase [Chitinispirillaceae bacterium]|nr:CCA tRNA nucleotidyltransferase [Chitinispirillaceae bacterium]
MVDAALRSKRQAALDIVSRLVKGGYTALFAGGYVRDMIHGGEKRGDIDIVTNATPQTITGLFAHTVGVGAQFGVVVVVESGIPFEVATFRSDIGINNGRHPQTVVFADARCDAGRRDFTINGMFYDPLTDTIIDYVNGRSDLEKGVIRAIGDPAIRFQEDYLRLLRAVRFAARFGFQIHEDTWQAIRENAPGVGRISPERIFSELDKMLRQPHPDHAVALLAEAGLLELVLPEVAACRGVEQPPQFHPEGDVFSHTLKALRLLGPASSPTLAWSVLLHDIGKKATMQWSDRIRFNNHDQVGARMARAVLKRLRASNDLIDSVVACVGNHMNFMNVMSMRLATLKKLLSRPTISDECELHRIDCCASHGNLENYNFVKKRLEHLAREEIKPPPLLRGTDLISLGLAPGPIFSSILREVYDLQLDEKVRTREEALELVRRQWIEGKVPNST